MQVCGNCIIICDIIFRTDEFPGNKEQKFCCAGLRVTLTSTVQFSEYLFKGIKANYQYVLTAKSVKIHWRYSTCTDLL
jgi:hypothetical protein